MECLLILEAFFGGRYLPENTHQAPVHCTALEITQCPRQEPETSHQDCHLLDSGTSRHIFLDLETSHPEISHPVREISFRVLGISHPVFHPQELMSFLQE